LGYLRTKYRMSWIALCEKSNISHWHVAVECFVLTAL
jgi:hypothetical protein